MKTLVTIIFFITVLIPFWVLTTPAAIYLTLQGTLMYPLLLLTPEESPDSEEYFNDLYDKIISLYTFEN